VLRTAAGDTWRLVKRHGLWDLALLVAVLIASLLLSSNVGIGAGLIPLAALALVAVTALVVNLILAPVQMHRAGAARESELMKRLDAVEESIRERTPQLTFGRAVLPRQSQDIVFGEGRGVRYSGRVIRVPVINAQGAGLAERVHARLRFLPGERGFGPEQAQAEWFNEHGPPQIEVDLPGNGRGRLLDVVVVLYGDYPNVYEWTEHSRAAALRGYGIMATPIDIEIVVMGAGAGPLSPRLAGLLRVALRENMLIADWVAGGPDDDPGGTNYAVWP
jgi:hypothetical protein